MGYTVNLTESIEHLMETHFPGFRTVDNNSTARARPRDVFKPRDWSLAAKIVHPKGVEWAVKTFKPYKSPGPDGIYLACLQEGLGLLIGPLVKVFRASIALRHVPLSEVAPESLLYLNQAGMATSWPKTSDPSALPPLF